MMLVAFIKTSLLISLFFIYVSQEMGLLEIKHGLLQIAESLNFLHSNAHLIHRAISPEVSILFQLFLCFGTG